MSFWNQESVLIQTLQTLQWYETKLFCTFSSKSLYALDKRIQSKCKFPDFQLLTWKWTKLLMSFVKSQVSFPLNFASPFSVVTYNPSETFGWNIIPFGQKEPINVQFLRPLNAVMKVLPILHANFETTRSGFIQVVHHYSVSWKITPLYFFTS